MIPILPSGHSAGHSAQPSPMIEYIQSIYHTGMMLKLYHTEYIYCMCEQEKCSITSIVLQLHTYVCIQCICCTHKKIPQVCDRIVKKTLIQTSNLVIMMKNNLTCEQAIKLKHLFIQV